MLGNPSIQPHDNDTVTIEGISLFGNTVTRTLSVNPNDLIKYFEGTELVQNIFPQLSPEDREFLINGDDL